MKFLLKTALNGRWKNELSATQKDQRIQNDNLAVQVPGILTGEFKKFLNLDFKRYTYAMAYSNKVQIRKDDVYEDSAAFDLGIILIDNPTIKRIN